MDLTPWVGIIGAVVGGSIGLVGQRMNIKEQRRKALVDRVIDYLNHTDRVRTITGEFVFGTPPIDLAARFKENFEMTEALIKAIDEGQNLTEYFDIAAPPKLAKAVMLVYQSVTMLNDVALRAPRARADSAAPDPSDVATSEATYAELEAKYDEARFQLLRQIYPKRGIRSERTNKSTMAMSQTTRWALRRQGESSAIKKYLARKEEPME